MNASPGAGFAEPTGLCYTTRRAFRMSMASP